MSNGNNRLGLEVTVPAEEWAYLKRRADYLEAVLVQVLRDKGRVREWFSATDLAALRLPGLPASKAALTRLANAQGWRRRERTGRGGTHFLYHVTNLPPRAFDHLISIIVGEAPAPAPPVVPDVPVPSPEATPPRNATAPWELPLLRLVKGGRVHSLDQACEQLRQALPPGVPEPTYDEVSAALDRLGVVL